MFSVICVKTAYCLLVACVLALAASISGCARATDVSSSDSRGWRADDFGPSRSKSNGLRAGYYTIQSLAESCGSRYLSSSEWGGRVTLQSAEAKAPRQWLVRPKAGSRDYTLTPDWGNTIGGINGNEGGNARLSYSKDCGSSSVNLSPKNMLSWTVRHSYRLKKGNTYSIVAAGKAAESKRNRQCPVYLGCIRDGAKGSVVSPGLLSETSPATSWRLNFVGPVRTPPSPPPPPPPLVKIDVVFITFIMSSETVESFGQTKQDALCTTIVAVSSDPRARCQVTSVTPVAAQNTGGRRIMQTGDGINVATQTAFPSNAEDSDPSARLKENLSEGSSVFGEDVQVTSATTASAEAPEGTPFEGFESSGESVPVPIPPATPNPTPNPPSTPSPTPTYTSTPNPTPALNRPTVTASPGTVKNQISVTGTAPTTANSGTTLKIACTPQGSQCPASSAAGWDTVTTSGTAKQVATLSDGTTAITKGTTYTCWSAEFHSTTYACSDPIDMIAYPYTVRCGSTADGGTLQVGGITYTKRDRGALNTLVSSPSSCADLATSCITGVTDLASLFTSKATFNEDIGTWDTSGVQTMTAMFEGATNFDQDIGEWDTGLVTRMSATFQDATTFNQDLSGWNVQNVQYMNSMFYGATAFNNGGAPLAWGSKTGEVVHMTNMFYRASVFNQDVSGWNVQKVEYMGGMFQDATAFNQDISSWDTNKVQNMNSMFAGATAFNNGGVPLAWDSKTGEVTSMLGMFKGASVFNQDISNWDTSKVTNMQEMFNNAAVFNWDITGWNVGVVTSCHTFCFGSPLCGSCDEPNFTLCTPGVPP